MPHVSRVQSGEYPSSAEGTRQSYLFDLALQWKGREIKSTRFAWASDRAATISYHKLISFCGIGKARIPNRSSHLSRLIGHLSHLGMSPISSKTPLQR